MSMDVVAAGTAQLPDTLKGVTISSPYLKRFQRIHALTLLWVPALGSLLAFYLAYRNGVHWGNITLFVVLYLLTMLGGSVGYHRLFAHRAFKTGRGMKCLLAILGSMTAQGTPIYWVSNHRRHHEYSDLPGDPHSPNLSVGETRWCKLKGLWFAQVSWTYKHELTHSARYAKDLMRDRDLSWISSKYYHWVLISLLVPCVLGAVLTHSLYGALEGLLWGGLFRIFLSYHATNSINSLTHMIGSRRHATQDKSTNIWVLGLLTVGESFHNNHHAFPASAKFAGSALDIDMGYWFIKLLASVGLVTDVRLPHRKTLKTGEHNE